MTRSSRPVRGTRTAAAALVCLVLVALASLAAQPVDRLDPDTLYRIKQEGFERSQVMELASWLTDVHGARLTGSPGYDAAARWARDTLAGWGLADARLEPFEFGRGWSNERISAHVLTPRPWPLIAYPKAWTPGTPGPVVAEAVLAVMEEERDFEKFRGRLAGKFVLVSPIRDVQAAFEPLARRHTSEGLETLARDPAAPYAPDRSRLGRTAFLNRRAAFLQQEGVAGVLEASVRGDGGTVFVSGGARDPKAPPVPPQLVVAIEHYGRLYRLLEKKQPVRLEIDIRNRFHEETTSAVNVLADIPGTDLRDEVVMIGAHLDSWHTGTGATDNAAGTAVMMEAARILVKSGVRLRRTVRIALWGGEEQGLLGSRAYVRQHFADRETMTLKPAHATLSGYFNVDNGSGAIRGIYLQGNEAVRPIFAAWTAGLADLGMTTVAIRGTGGTDHLAFDAVGLPGFQFIQDPLEYSTRTHHSNMDTYERLQRDDLVRNAVIVATFAAHAANRDEKLPRKPLPPAQRIAPVPSASAAPTTATRE